MLNVALAGLLAGTLLIGPSGGDDDDKKGKKADAQESVVIVGDEAAETPLQDRYALGREADESPIKLWIEYGFGGAESIYDPAGEEQECSVGPGGALLRNCDIASQRATVGVQINPISFDRFGIGIGGVLTAAKNELQPGGDATGLLASTGLSSDFSVQNLKIYAEARGRTLGIHGGYLLDLGDLQEFGEGGIPLDITRSDNRNAINLGADFDYPARGFRVFGAIDHYILGQPDCSSDATNFPEFCSPNTEEGDENAYGEEGDGVWNFMFGSGVRLSFAEVGAALQIVARDRQPVERNGAGTPGTTPNIGGYVGSISPYLRLKPPGFPASVYVKGGLLDEYNTYGYPLGGANGPKPSFGLTFGASVGFE